MAHQYFEASSHAKTYNLYRPSPPDELAKCIVEYLKKKVSDPLKRAVDMGCGGGQSTVILAPYFEEVIGLEPSKEQVEITRANNKVPNIQYKVSSAEEIDLPDSSVQLVMTVQACHWFNLDKFYSEVERILQPGGVLALCGYKLPKPYHKETGSDLLHIVEKYYNVVLSDYVFPESRKVYINNYKDQEFNNFPFTNEAIIRKESISYEMTATLADLIGYVSSWSGFQNYVQKEGENNGSIILKNFEKEVLDTLHLPNVEPEKIQLSIVYEFFVLMGRKITCDNKVSDFSYTSFKCTYSENGSLESLSISPIPEYDDGEQPLQHASNEENIHVNIDDDDDDVQVFNETICISCSNLLEKCTCDLEVLLTDLSFEINEESPIHTKDKQIDEDTPCRTSYSDESPITDNQQKKKSSTNIVQPNTKRKKSS